MKPVFANHHEVLSSLCMMNRQYAILVVTLLAITMMSVSCVGPKYRFHKTKSFYNDALLNTLMRRYRVPKNEHDTIVIKRHLTIEYAYGGFGSIRIERRWKKNVFFGFLHHNSLVLVKYYNKDGEITKSHYFSPKI